MSEHADSQQISRPAFQRYELGPLMAAITPQLFSNARRLFPEILSNCAQRQPRNNTSTEVIGVFAEVLEMLARASAKDWAEADSIVPTPELRQQLSLQEGLERLMGEYAGFTYYDLSSDVVEEGFVSGLILPLKVYGVMTEKSVFDTEDSKQACVIRRFDINHFRQTVVSNDFDAILRNHFAEFWNGALGAWSTSAGSGYSGGGVVGRTQFSRTEDRIYVSNETACRRLQDRREVNSKARTGQAKRYEESGGCPVRYDRYKNIGPIALAAITRAGLDPAAFASDEHISPITQCRDFAVQCVEELAEVFEESISGLQAHYSDTVL